MLPGFNAKPLIKDVISLVRRALGGNGGSDSIGYRSGQSVTAALDATQANVARLAGRNRLINPTFTVNERRYVNGTPLSAGIYGHDRWKAGGAGATYSLSGETITIAAGSLLQVIEGINVSEGGTYTLSWVGTATGRVDGGAFVSSPITVSGKTAGANTNIEFSTGTVARPQYEAGNAATMFERRLQQAEDMLCRPYCRRQTTNVLAGVLAQGSNTSTTSARIIYRFDSKMRAAPTCTVIGAPADTTIVQSNLSQFAATAVSVVGASPFNATIDYTISGATANFPVYIAPSTTNECGILFSAEL